MATSRASIFVHLMVCLFGIGSWVDINGVWVELPIMVQSLPEGWALGSYLVIIIQLANIGPLFVTLMTVFAPGKLKEKPIVYAILVVGAVACLLLAFLWDRVMAVSGVKHSVALLVLQFFLALVDCTSSVAFLPFMSIFKQKYMTTYFIGEGLSGLLPSLVAWIQGAGAVKCVTKVVTVSNITSMNYVWQNQTSAEVYPEFLPPRFPVRTFFIFLFIMMICCCTAFTLLNYHPVCQSQWELQPKGDKSSSVQLIAIERVQDKNMDVGLPSAEDNVITNLMDEAPTTDNVNNRKAQFRSQIQGVGLNLPRHWYLYYLVLTGWMNALTNAVLPSVQTFSALPYGLSPYHLTVILASISNPSACCLAYVLPTRSTTVISTVSVLGSLLSAYIVILALMSPDPFLKSEWSGETLMVFVWVLTILSLSYAKVTVAVLFRIEGKKALLWCGAAQQIGSAFGAIVMFILVNVSKLFESAPLC